MDAIRYQIRTMVRGSYDLQKIRIQMGNRIVSNFKVKLGIEPGAKEEDLSDRERTKLLKQLHREYRRITDGVVELGADGDGIISTETELVLVGQYVSILKQESTQFRQIGKQMIGIPIWDKFLKGVKGIGPQMGGVIISEIDIMKRDEDGELIVNYASCLWKYAGLDVVRVPDGNGGFVNEGRSRKETHREMKPYINKDGEEDERLSLTFKPFLKTKLIGVLGPSFIKSGSLYSEIYYDYRNRLENHVVYGVNNDEVRIAEFKAAGKKYSPKAHRHNMAIRYMIKMFLIDLFNAWREMEGLTVPPPYHEAKLGMKHSHQ